MGLFPSSATVSTLLSQARKHTGLVFGLGPLLVAWPGALCDFSSTNTGSQITTVTFPLFQMIKSNALHASGAGGATTFNTPVCVGSADIPMHKAPSTVAQPVSVTGTIHILTTLTTLRAP